MALNTFISIKGPTVLQNCPILSPSDPDQLHGGGGGGGGTLNVEVIGMLVGTFFYKTLKKYPDFDFKLLKIPKLQFLELFWEKWLPFSKHFPEA